MDAATLTGHQKTAILLLAMPEEGAAALLDRLDPAAAVAIAAEVAAMEAVPGETVATVLRELVGDERAAVTGGPAAAERLLRRVREARPGAVERAAAPAAVPAEEAADVWVRLSRVNDRLLAQYLRNEYPQTVALVLARLAPAQAARVLAQLPESFALEATMRLLRLERVRPEVQREVERVLERDFLKHMTDAPRRDTHEIVADIFNGLDRCAEHRFLAALDERNRDSAERIRALMFTFEDLARLAPGAIQALLRNVDKTRLGLALKGASDTLRDAFFKNMSERAGKILREDMAAMGPVRVRDVDEAQGYLVRLAKDLADRGELHIPVTGDTGEDLIY